VAVNSWMGGAWEAKDRGPAAASRCSSCPRSWRPNTGAMGRSLHDARAGSAVNRPNIYAIDDFDEENAKTSIATELPQGWAVNRKTAGPEYPGALGRAHP
jgi:hypothetical protein